MDFLLPLSFLLLLRPTFASRDNQGVRPFHGLPSDSPFRSFFRRRPLRSHPSTPHRIPECVYVTSEERVYVHVSADDSDAVCGVYLFTEADRVVEVHFEEMDVPCESGGLVTFFDGWELNGKFFPGVEDHEKPFGKRYQEFCGSDTTSRVFRTSQNAGMIHYRVPAKGKGFRFYLRFPRNPAPCNILVESKEDDYTLRNHGRANNCTLMAVFPAKIKVLSLDVGAVTPLVETGTIQQHLKSKHDFTGNIILNDFISIIYSQDNREQLIVACQEKRMTDRLELGGSEDLDSSQIVLFDNICGLDSSPGVEEMVIGCGVSIVRLVSSGHFENSATVSVGQPEEEELVQSTFTCGL